MAPPALTIAPSPTTVAQCQAPAAESSTFLIARPWEAPSSLTTPGQPAGHSVHLSASSPAPPPVTAHLSMRVRAIPTPAAGSFTSKTLPVPVTHPLLTMVERLAGQAAVLLK